MSIKLTKIEQRIFNKIMCEWEKRVGKGNVDEPRLKDIIRLCNTDGDGKKRVAVHCQVYLVPIEDIILDGLRGVDVPKYPKAEPSAEG